MAVRDFTANQIRTAKIIMTGSAPSGGIAHKKLELSVYSESVAPDQLGGNPVGNTYANVGNDISIFVSGSQTARSGVNGGGVLFQGDTYISGTLVVKDAGRNAGGSISGSIHHTADGSSYMVAGAGIEIASGSNGQVTITSTISTDVLESLHYYDEYNGTPDLAPNASGVHSIAIGDGAHAAGSDSLVFGNNVTGSGQHATIFGGINNVIEETLAGSNRKNAIFGGQSNLISGSSLSVIAGGVSNHISGTAGGSAGSDNSGIFGGYENKLSGSYSTIIGGIRNKTEQNYTTVIGQNLTSSNTGEVVIGFGSTYAGGGLNRTIVSGSNFIVAASNISVFNEDGATADFRVEGSSAAIPKKGAILVDGGTNQVVIQGGGVGAAASYGVNAATSVLPAQISTYISGACGPNGSTPAASGVTVIAGDLLISGSLFVKPCFLAENAEQPEFTELYNPNDEGHQGAAARTTGGVAFGTNDVPVTTIRTITANTVLRCKNMAVFEGGIKGASPLSIFASGSTDALVVSGNVEIVAASGSNQGANLTISGSMTVTGSMTVSGSNTFTVYGPSIFNADQNANNDFQIKSATNANIFYVDSSADGIGIGTTTPGSQLEIQDKTASSANTGGSLRLSSNDGAAMGDSHRLGVIEFTGAEDSSNTQIAGARIEALTDSAWTNVKNDTALYFYVNDENNTAPLVLKLDSNKKSTFNGVIDITDTTDATDDTGDTGALRVEGGASIAKKLFVGTDLTVTGDLIVKGATTTISSSNLVIQDSIIGLGFSGSSDAGAIFNNIGDRAIIFGRGASTTSALPAINYDGSNSNIEFATFIASPSSGSMGAPQTFIDLSTGNINATGFVKASTGLSGSLTRLTDGKSYLVAGTSVTITSASNGQVTVSVDDSGIDTQNTLDQAYDEGGTAVGAKIIVDGQPVQFEVAGSSKTAFAVTGSVFIGSGSIIIPGPDTNFFVSGTIGSKGTSIVGTSVFGGDVVISGTLHGGSPLDVGTDINLIVDGSKLAFGVNNEITFTHVHDVGLTVTNTINGTDNRPVVFQLKSEEDAIVADDVIASLEFAAGDSDGTDGATVAAGIHAIAESTFTDTSNPTKLVFTTGFSETAAAGATEKMTLDSIGRLIVADDLVIGDGKTIGTLTTNEALTLAAGGLLTAANGITSTATANTFGATSFNDANITNVGDINCDSISVDDAAVGLDIQFGGNTTLNKFTLTDNLADALNITEAGNSYIKFITTNASEAVVVAKKLEVSSGIIDVTNATENSILIPDNKGDALVIKEGSNLYAKFATTNAAELVTFFKDVLIQDDKKLLFGTNSDAYIEYDEDGSDSLVVHVPAAGFSIMGIPTADNSPVRLNLLSNEAELTANEVVGQIDFQAIGETGTDAIEICASIQAIAEAAFDASSNQTKLAFFTAKSEDATSVAAKLEINHGGSVTMNAGATTSGGNGFDGGEDGAPTADVQEINNEVVTTFKINIDDMVSTAGSGARIIGDGAGAANAYFARLNSGVNGLIYKAEMICVEAPTTGEPDLDLYAKSDIQPEGGGVAGDFAKLIDANGDWFVSKFKETISPFPGSSDPAFTHGLHNYYLYLANGNGGTSDAGTYGAGKWLVRLYGVKTFGT